MKKLAAFIFLCLTLLSVTPVPLVYAEQSVEEREVALRKELEQYEKELADLNKQLSGLKVQSATYERDLNLLTTQIRTAQTNIKAKGIAIQNLGKEIEQKTKTVATLDARIADGQEAIGEMIRNYNQLDSQSIIEVILAEKNLALFFEDLQAYISIQDSMQDLFDEIRGNKVKTLAEKEALRDRQNKEFDAKKAIEAAERQIAVKQAEAKQLLDVSKNKEAGYQTIIAEKQRKAAAIRTALFSLRDAAAISFGDALKYANNASKSTGVRAAFILGILKQESNLGVNVGQCYLSDPDTGAGKGKNTGTPFANVMKPTRDVAPFLDLTGRLGVDPYSTVVSCPQSIGYGGAMGPAQFIPSTWAMYEPRIAATMGIETPNPWNAEHAIYAMAIFLKDLGAGAGTPSSEQQAAGRYYAGGNWATLGLGYANSVANHAATFQENIEFLESVQ
jgi:membrane-bound lytic murein transglycosylase B